MKEKETGVSVAVALLVAVAVTPLSAWVLQTLWLWFLVPLGIPAVGMAHAFGIFILVGTFRASRGKDNRPLSELSVAAISNPLAGLLLGYIAHRFMR